MENIKCHKCKETTKNAKGWKFVYGKDKYFIDRILFYCNKCKKDKK